MVRTDRRLQVWLQVRQVQVRLQVRQVQRSDLPVVLQMVRTEFRRHGTRARANGKRRQRRSLSGHHDRGRRLTRQLRGRVKTRSGAGLQLLGTHKMNIFRQLGVIPHERIKTISHPPLPNLTVTHLDSSCIRCRIAWAFESIVHSHGA